MHGIHTNKETLTTLIIDLLYFTHDLIKENRVNYTDKKQIEIERFQELIISLQDFRDLL